MKRIAVICLALLFFTSMTTPSYGQLSKEIGVVSGKVLSIDKRRKKIAVKDTVTGTEVILKVTAEQMNGLKKGRVALVTYKKDNNVVIDLLDITDKVK